MNPTLMLHMRRKYLARNRCRIYAWLSCGTFCLISAVAMSIELMTPGFIAWLASAAAIGYGADKAAVFYADYRLWSSFQ